MRLLTVHRSKGLEFELAAVFDAGRMLVRSDALYLDPARAAPACPAATATSGARRAQARDAQESYRLLYVAASRARRPVSPAASRGETPGLGRRAGTLGAGPTPPGGVELSAPAEEVPLPAASDAQRTTAAPEPAPWVERRFAPPRFPAVISPTRLGRNDTREPLPPSDPDDAAAPAGRAAAIGTLVHYAIGQDWRPEDAGTHANLVAQEVMFAFSPGEREEIMGEVLDLLRRYRSMLGASLPELSARRHDRPELPVAVPYGGTVWQGVIDRLYQAGGRWVVEDYKTDAEVRPERYAFQLALYAHAVERALGERPLARLAFLRPREVVELDDAALAAALTEAAEGGAS